MKLSEKRAIQIVKDLLQKYPKGPRGRKGYKKEDYVQYRDWDDNGNYRNFVKLSCDTPNFGYKDDDLVQLSFMTVNGDSHDGFRTSEWDFKYLIRAIYPELPYQSKAVTSRSRRLTQRVGRHVSRLIRGGTLAGVYKIVYDYGETGGEICAYGSSAEDAQAVAQLMCSHAFPGKDIRRTELVTAENVGAITQLNGKAVKSCQDEIERFHKRITELQEKIATLESRQSVISMFSTQQVCAMAGALETVE